MMPTTRTLLSFLFAALPLTFAATIDVTVGGPGILKYTPEFVNANIGDVVRFTFKQKNHTATQSTLASPCASLQGGFDSGFLPVADTATSGFPVAELTIRGTEPIWVYCRQGNHCQQGMVFAVNPGDEFVAFKAAATGGAAPSNPPATSTTPGAPSVTTVTATVTVAGQPVTTTYATTVTAGSPSPSSTIAVSSDHRVIVGGPGKFTYEPSNITAQPGDTVTFEFRQKNHTVTASSFEAPCRALSLTSTTGEVGFDSGFMVVADGTTPFPTYILQVNDTKPIWAYCRQAGHCGQGMVFSVNADESGPSNFAAFKAQAIRLNGTQTPPGGSTSGALNTKGAGILGVLLAVAAVSLV